MNGFTKLEAALDVPIEDREAWLSEQCGGDEALRREIESIWACEQAADGFLERSIDPYLSSLLDGPEPSARHGATFGRYTILREIGSGGMGAVFLAERSDGEFDQRVAIKIIRQTIAEKELVDRFKRERQILASLNHPNIATLLDGGVSDGGEPFLVMEYIEGEPLLTYADSRRLDTKARLKLFLKVCGAVAFAHQNLVVHRDIKPSNILVNDTGEPKLLDFGLAKAFDEALPEEDHTQTAFRALTPAYASPEQLRGAHVSTASDIYSLGVVLYELLTGKRPYKLSGSSLEEVLRAVSTDEPARPSDASGDADADRLAPALASQLRGDLDNIVLMALRKEPGRRYGSAADLAADIERYLDGRPIIARPNTLSYRANKFIRRNKIAVAAAAAVVVTFLAGLILAVWQADVARHERDHAHAERAKAEKISQFLASALAYSDPSAAAAGTANRRDATVSQMLDDFAPKIETELASQPDIRASLQRTVGLAYLSQLRTAEAERYLNSALETHLALFGEDHPETAFTLSSVAQVKASLGDYAGAEKILENAADIFHRNSPLTEQQIRAHAGGLSSLGGVYWTRGNFAGAEAAYRESLSLATDFLSHDRSAIADAKAGLGLTLYAQGHLDEAVVLLREAVGEYRGLPHARWALPDALNHFGQALIWRGDYEEALAALRESESVGLEVFGERSASYARSLWLQVYALCFSGRCIEARGILDRSASLYDRWFTDNNVIKANVADARNVVLTRTGKPGEGEMFGRRAVKLYETSQSRGTPSITLARINLADSLIAQDKYTEAERVLLAAYKDAIEAKGPEHWRTRQAAERLAALYAATGRADLASNFQ